jgi:hypothetical protein
MGRQEAALQISCNSCVRYHHDRAVPVSHAGYNNAGRRRIGRCSFIPPRSFVSVLVIICECQIHQRQWDNSMRGDPLKV